MHTHLTHYTPLEPAFSDPPDLIRTHIDHCLEMLRTILSCNADPGIVTFNWVEGHESPMPDFSTVHRCRKVENVLGWAREKERERKVAGSVRRPPEGVMEVREGEYFGWEGEGGTGAR